MIKRTKGYLLLTLLVLTGLAGRMHTETLTGKERRQLVNELRTSRNNFRLAVWDLSDKQLSFRPSRKSPNIKECIYQLAAIDQYLNRQRLETLKNSSGSDKRVEVSATQVIPVDQTTYSSFEPLGLSKYGSAMEAWNSFMINRNELLKYARTTTGNVRSYKVNTPKGVLDLYELILLDCTFTGYYRAEIEKIRRHPRFPQ